MRVASLSFIFLVFALSAACSDKSGDERTPSTQARAATAETPTTAEPGPTPVPAAKPSSGCLGDEGGCRARMLDIPLCESEKPIETVSLQQLHDRPADHAGRAIALRGPLIKSGSECTEGACERTCCNTCTSVVTLGDDEKRQYVRLASVETPGLYLCRGDESLVCCQYPTDGREVVARGEFMSTTNTTPVAYQLFVTELCRQE